MTDDDPAVYLNQPPTPREHVLGQLVDLHDGAHVPFRMLAALAVRLHDATQWIATRVRIEGAIKRTARAGLLTLLANVVLVGGVAVHSLKESGAAEEREAQRAREFLEYRDSERREHDRLEQDIRDLRRDLRRMSGADKLGPDGMDETPDPDKLSLLDGSTPLLTAGALSSTSVITPPRPGPRTCGDFCNSSIQCASHFGRVCPFCSFGTCSAIRPEEPTDPPPDAGVDAAPGGTTR